MAKVKKKVEEVIEEQVITEPTSEKVEEVIEEQPKMVDNIESTENGCIQTANEIIDTPQDIIVEPKDVIQTVEETLKENTTEKKIIIEHNKPQRVKYSTKGMFGYDWLGLSFD